METKTLIADLEPEISHANKLAKEMTLADLPSILTHAMFGQYPTTVTKTRLQTTDTFSEEAKGLIFSKNDLKNILRYVTMGLNLPQNNREIRKEMPYTDHNNPYLKTSYYYTVFHAIKDHCKRWQYIQQDILKQGKELNIFAKNFCIKGEKIVDIIESMPIYQQAVQTVEDTTITFDQSIKKGLMSILNSIRADVNRQKRNVLSLSRDIQRFAEILNSQINPYVSQLEGAVSTINLTEERSELEKQKSQLEHDIDQAQQTYNKLVGYAFTGTAGLVLGPLGIISWAITGGIYGKKAEEVRKHLNELKNKRESIAQEIASLSLMDKHVQTMKSHVLNIATSIENAQVGITHLMLLWDTTEADIENAQEQLEQIDGSKELILFKVNIASSIDSWKDVDDITDKLIKTFDETLKEVQSA